MSVRGKDGVCLGGRGSGSSLDDELRMYRDDEVRLYRDDEVRL